ncbi:ribonuclease P protein component [Lacibacterium aquatile]|uniref:Ribonuclease P protein component n=1 Tax=Lacibacterium aquatile TaxID=1168082 RepID=A0ABW5DW38_9PROT
MDKPVELLQNSEPLPTPRLAVLQRRSEFLRVADARRKFAVPGLVLQVYERREATGPARLGFTASKKVGNSVARNRARRRLREAAWRLVGKHGLEGHDYVLIAREATLERPWPDLLTDLQAAMKRLKAWNDKGLVE